MRVFARAANQPIAMFSLVTTLAAGPIAAQNTAQTVLPGDSVKLSGIVRDGRTSAPIAGANVFILGTLRGALTDSAGRFSFAAKLRANDTVIVKRLGYGDAQVVLDRGHDSIVVELSSASSRIAPVVVRASRYAASDEPGAVLTPLEIVTIPGTTADVNRAIQTLPGVQQVDDGTGLYVRGGDYTETRVYLNDGRLLNPTQLQSSSGTFVGTLDPFLLDAVSFSSGGFDARYGDALSGVVELRTQRRPDWYSATISAGLGAVGANIAAPGPRGTGIRMVADENNLAPVVRLNGSPREFSVAPRGGDRTVSAFWNYRPTALVSVFATDQRNRVATLTASPSVVDTFATVTRDRAAVAVWSDVFGPFAPRIVVSSSMADRSDAYGSFELFSPASLARGTASTDWTMSAQARMRIGLEFGTQRTSLEGSVPASGSDQSTSARVRLYDYASEAHASALYQEIEWQSESRLRLTAGYRYDRSTATSRATLDPRANFAYKVSNDVVLTAAWGYYHQAVDPVLQALAVDSTTSLAAMSARHAIAGIQIGEAMPMVRLEVYDKRYRDLAALNRDFVTIAHGTGASRGIDVIARLPAVAGIDARVVYDYVHSFRTDPSSGEMAPAPADVTHGLTIIGTRSFGSAVILGGTFRYASGRPFTPVVAATRTSDGKWTPVYAAPGSDRLPAYARLDLSASVVRLVTPRMQVVMYTAIMNALGRPNVFTRQYTADYAERHDVASIFNRSLYFGGVLTLTRQ